MAKFSGFLNSFDPDSKGKEFESFVKWFLKNDPEWSTQVNQVWLWDDYPDRWGRDCGVDLVFKHKNGDIWAVQAKCYSPEYSITKSDVDKFLSESNRKGVDRRLLIASTDQIGANAKQVCDAQEKPVTHFLFSDFDKSAIEYPNNLSELNTARRKERPSPRPHQKEAIDAVEKGFKESDRGQLIMACGTGKTFTTLWIKERISAETTLVLVPSLSLLSQTLREWTFACNTPFDGLCVCSDQSVGKRSNEDEIVQSVKDVPFPVTV
jgi:predicted helicase